MLAEFAPWRDQLAKSRDESRQTRREREKEKGGERSLGRENLKLEKSSQTLLAEIAGGRPRGSRLTQDLP